MPFEDRLRSESFPPDEWYELERVPSGDVSGQKPRDAPPESDFEGRRGIYRLAFKAMEVWGFPDEIKIGNATITQGPGPIRTQRVHIAQEPGLGPRYVKRMEWPEIGGDGFLTLCELDVKLPPDLAHAMNAWSNQARTSVAIVAAVLDERVAQEQLTEDLLIFDEEGVHVVNVMDQVYRLRQFQSANRMLPEHIAALEKAVGGLDLGEDSPILSASRWYLRGAQLGPTPDAIVYFWVALEALAKPPYGTKLSAVEKSRTDVAWVERAARSAGVDLQQVVPSIGRLAGLRAEIVHGGVEQPALLNEGHYTTEALVRHLLRHRLGLGVLGWPAHPGHSNLTGTLKAQVERLQKRPKVEWKS